MKFIDFNDLNNHLLQDYETELIPLDEYNWYSYHVEKEVPFILRYIHDDTYVAIMRLYIKYIHHGLRELCIPVSELETIIIDINKFSSKLPKWLQSITNIHDTPFKQQKRFLRKQCLYDSIDYEMHIEIIDGIPIPMGYSICRFAMNRILIRIYGSDVFSLIMNDISCVLYNYCQYQSLFHATRIESLNRTIVGFSSDIGELHNTINSMKHNECLSPISEKDSYDSTPMLGDDSSNPSSEFTDLRTLVKDKENSTLTVGIMCDMLEELTATLNRNIDERISIINIKIDKIATALVNFVDSDAEYDCATGIANIEPQNHDDIETKINAHIDEMKQEYDHVMKTPYWDDSYRVSTEINHTKFITNSYENDVSGDNKINERWIRARRNIKSRERQFTF